MNMILGLCFLSDDSQLFDAVLMLSNDTHQLALTIGAGFFVFTLAWTYLMRLFKGDGGFPFAAFFRYLVFFIVLLLYFPIMELASGMLCAVGNHLPDVGNVKDLMNDSHATWYGTLGAALMGESPNLLFDIVKANLLVLIRTVMEFIKTILASILFILGPLAIALDMLPFFNGVALKWFRNFVSVLLWTLIFAILDHFVIAFSQTFVDGGSASAGFWYALFVGQDTSDAMYMASNFCFMIMYLSSPMLTSWIVGSSTVGAAASKIVGAGIGGAVVGAKVAGGAASGGSTLLAEAAGGSAGSSLSKMNPFSKKNIEGGGSSNGSNTSNTTNSKPSENL